MKIPQKELLDNYLSAGHGQYTDLSNYDAQYRIYLSNYKQFFPKNKSAKILDFGCGYGHFLYLLKKEGYQNYLGIDTGKENIDFCNKYITKNVLYMDDSMTFLDDNENTFDFIILNDVLEHIPKSETINLLKSLHKALREGGKLILKMPNHSNPYSIRERYNDFSHEIGFNEQSLEQVLRMSGFIHNEYFGFRFSKYSLKGIIGEFVRGILLWTTRVHMYLLGISSYNVIMHPVFFSVSKK